MHYLKYIFWNSFCNEENIFKVLGLFEELELSSEYF